MDRGGKVRLESKRRRRDGEMVGGERKRLDP